MANNHNRVGANHSSKCISGFTKGNSTKNRSKQNLNNAIRI